MFCFPQRFLMIMPALVLAACSANQSITPSQQSSSTISTSAMHSLSSGKSSFVFSISPASLIFFHATSPQQILTIVVADSRTLTTAVQDPTVASAVENAPINSLPGPNGSGFTNTWTVTPLKAGITNLVISDNKGPVATIPIDVYGELSVSVASTPLHCHDPRDCSTSGGATLNLSEPYYPNGFNLSYTTTCAGTTFVASNSTSLSLSLTNSGLTTLATNALNNNSKTGSVTCTSTVNDDHSGTASMTSTFTITFTTLQRGSGL